MLAVVKGIGGSAGKVGTSVNVNHDGEVGFPSPIDPNIEGEAIFALLVQGGWFNLVFELACRVTERVANPMLVRVLQPDRSFPA